MSVVLIVLSVVLALMLLMAGAPKLLGAPAAMVDELRVTFDRLGVSRSLMRLVGAAEVGLAVLLVVAVVVGSELLALLAGIGALVVLLGALVSHLRVKDTVSQYAPVLVFLAVSTSVVAVGALA
ncbi:DoxX family protein [Nocardioides salarius]|uniref:DoxX family protein n=1 Tax=Nocardioides salarius TaxID=374513 RepID=UPI0030F562EC